MTTRRTKDSRTDNNTADLATLDSEPGLADALRAERTLAAWAEWRRTLREVSR